ncbi:sucrose synthase [Tanacetum coccineum]
MSFSSVPLRTMSTCMLAADTRHVFIIYGIKNKPILFTMARLDNVKNLTGLVEWYAKNDKLRRLVKLVVVGGDRRKESKDLEEQAQLKKMLFVANLKYVWTDTHGRFTQKVAMTLPEFWILEASVKSRHGMILRRYLKMFYALKYRKLAESVPLAVDEEK